MPTNTKYAEFLAGHPKTQTDVALAQFSSIGIGGPADLYFKLEKPENLEPLIKSAHTLKIPVFVLGGGTNTVFADEGFRGLVIHIIARKVSLMDPDGTGYRVLAAEAGALLSQVVAFALKNNLAGLEKLMGLPGTIGGAVRGNAGAHGTEIADVFHKALLYSPEKGIYEAGRSMFNFSYRHSSIKGSNTIILKVYLRLEEKDCTEAVKTGTEIITKRIIIQPKGHTTGSFFKNPGAGGQAGSSDPASVNSAGPESKAGYLLEQSGCKGIKVGGVQVSKEHANWIINEGGATQKDLLELARLMRQKVLERFKVSLEPEVQLVGETGPLTL